MTIKKMNITHEQHDEFVKQHPNGDMLQLTKWAESKKLTGWYSRRIAVGDGEKITGVAQLLFKKVPKLPYTLCYISRGFVVDYKDETSVKVLFELSKEIARNEKSYAIKIDPDIEVDQSEGVLEYLTSLGFEHKGFEDGLSKKYIQPRMTMITKIDQPEEDLMQSFDKRNRSRVRNSLKRGTELVIGNRDDLKIFAKIMEETGERDNFLTRDVSYFENIYDHLHPDGDCELFLVKVVPDTVLKDLFKERDALLEEKEKLTNRRQTKKVVNQLNDADEKLGNFEKRIQEMEELKSRKPDGVYLSGGILIFSGKKSYYLYGASSNEYREFLPNHRMIIEMMRFAKEKGANKFDFGGTDNNPDQDHEHYGLWAFKRVWGTYLSEKIGEFDYVLNKPLYTAIEKVKPAVVTYKRKIEKKIKRN